MAGAILIALTRVLLTVHYLSDVVAATALAFFTVLALRSLFLRLGLTLEPRAHISRVRVPLAAARVIGLRPAQREPLHVVPSAPLQAARYRTAPHAAALERRAAASEY